MVDTSNRGLNQLARIGTKRARESSECEKRAGKEKGGCFESLASKEMTLVQRKLFKVPPQIPGRKSVDGVSS